MRIHWLVVAGLGLFIGCGSGSELPRVNVLGKVSYQGQPIAEGTIMFVPIKETKGPAASGMIDNGAYKVCAAGGVPVGTHRVEIHAFRPVANAPDLPPALRERSGKQQYLPKEYNNQSTLEMIVTDQTVQTQDFDLK